MKSGYSDCSFVGKKCKKKMACFSCYIHTFFSSFSLALFDIGGWHGIFDLRCHQAALKNVILCHLVDWCAVVVSFPLSEQPIVLVPFSVMLDVWTAAQFCLLLGKVPIRLQIQITENKFLASFFQLQNAATECSNLKTLWLNSEIIMAYEYKYEYYMVLNMSGAVV